MPLCDTRIHGDISSGYVIYITISSISQDIPVYGHNKLIARRGVVFSFGVGKFDLIFFSTLCFIFLFYFDRFLSHSI